MSDETDPFEIETEEISCGITEVGCWIDSAFDVLLAVLLWWPRKSFEVITEGLGKAIAAIPPPEAFAKLEEYSGAFSSAGYLADVFAVPEGIAIVTGALVARFLLRRIPLVG